MKWSTSAKTSVRTFKIKKLTEHCDCDSALPSMHLSRWCLQVGDMLSEHTSCEHGGVKCKWMHENRCIMWRFCLAAPDLAPFPSRAALSSTRRYDDFILGGILPLICSHLPVSVSSPEAELIKNRLTRRGWRRRGCSKALPEFNLHHSVIRLSSISQSSVRVARGLLMC